MRNQPFYRRLAFAISGFISTARSQASFRTQLLAALAVLLILLWRQPAPIWWALLLINCALVLAAELFNTAMEHALDLLHPQIHPLVKLAKDAAAGAVLMLSCSALLTFAAFVYSQLGAG